jgi:hypothetical protein
MKSRRKRTLVRSSVGSLVAGAAVALALERIPEACSRIAAVTKHFEIRPGNGTVQAQGINALQINPYNP